MEKRKAYDHFKNIVQHKHANELKVQGKLHASLTCKSRCKTSK